MKVLLVHPGSLMYSELYLRLEPLGLELIAQACRSAGHDVRIIDLQVFKPGDYFRLVDEWRPHAVGYSLNYLANIPQVIDLARDTRQKLPQALILAGGHSASFVAREILDHAAGALNCIVRGEGEEVVPRVLAQGQTNFVKMLWKSNSVYNPGRQLADHLQPVKYVINLPDHGNEPLVKSSLYVHHPQALAAASDQASGVA